MRKIAIFASGSGTNAERIIKYFGNSDIARVSLILSDNKEALVLERAKRMNVPTEVFNKGTLSKSDKILNVLIENKIDVIVLAGFLLLIPINIVQQFHKRIVNIHPALLPLYGGKGMYGANVHNAIIKNMDTESGITIHYVNEKYDDGTIIFQAKCKIEKNETPITLAEKIHIIEHQYFPIVIENIIKDLD